MKWLYNNPVVFLTKKMWEYSESNRHNVVLYVVLAGIAHASYLLEPLVVARVLNEIQERGVTVENMPALLGLLSLFMVISVVFWFLHGPSRVIEMSNAFLVRAKYKNHLLKGTMNLPSEWHTDHHSGDTIDKIEKGTRALFEFSSSTYQIISAVVALVGSYIALAIYNVHSAYIVGFMLVIVFFVITRIDKVLVRQYKQLNRAENKISERIFDTISNITTVIILRVEKLLADSIAKTIMRPFGLFVKNNKINEAKWFFVSMATATMLFLVLSSYIFFNIRAGSVIMIGTIYALYRYAQRINNVFFDFAHRYSTIVQQRTAVMNAEEVSNEFRTKSDHPYVTLKKKKKWQELSIESLSFSYHTEEGADLHLDDISTTIQNGERIALVGDSGSGKSTFLKVIRNLYVSNDGSISLDGKQLQHGFSSISDDISLIPQDPEIFTTTILENITLGVEYDIDYVKKFTDMAVFTEVVNQLPNKFGSSIVEKGVNLSGGEKQRLALARGLLASADKAIVLLDEPTSSVDTRNELQIYKNIFAGFSNKTILSSVHRLHLLPLFDRVYYFEDGSIVASGRFDDLLDTSSNFKLLWEKYKKSSLLDKAK